MSLFDIGALGPRALVAGYLLDSLGRGLCLAYEDDFRVKSWLEAAQGDADRVLLVLETLLPEAQKRLGDGASVGRVTRLLHRKVLRALGENPAMLRR